ncbi:MAG TPA: phytanoyl-CoA dioxygenase family protein, partial [Thermoanaerobaculia bacterium]|nr:phytanoyl-CoA dioxygenase family protein [Thermoanaerobaculia bacterium]
YVRIQLDPAAEPLDQLLSDVDRLWREKPADLLYAGDHPALRPLSVASENERRPGVRIQEMHSHSEAARDLYLHPRLHKIAALILGETPVAIQSIFFEYGSAQALHRDPVFVQTSEAGHLLAAWIALEDILPSSGPLLYVPGSHTLPPYEFRPGVYRFDSQNFGDAERAAERRWLEERMAERNLEIVRFTPKKGEVLFWHAGLYHGGEAILDESQTRRSFVIHYSSRRTHHVAAAMISEPSPSGEDRLRIVATHRMVQKGHALGFANPLSRREFQWLPTLRNRIAKIWEG